MEIWQAVVLGLVQGLTEFLPVSSSGHVAFFQGVFGISGDDIALFFTIILHLGTLVAVCVVFWRDILALFKKPFKTLGLLVLATVPAGITGVLFEFFDLDEVLLSRQYMGIILSVFFLITAAVLFATEMIAKRRVNVLPLCLKTTVPMGLAQALAVLPGISRSGSTISGLQKRGSCKILVYDEHSRNSRQLFRRTRARFAQRRDTAVFCKRRRNPRLEHSSRFRRFCNSGAICHKGYVKTYTKSKLQVVQFVSRFNVGNLHRIAFHFF